MSETEAAVEQIRVHDVSFLAIDADVRLHAEVPLIALLRLMHFWIALLLLVLR